MNELRCEPRLWPVQRKYSDLMLFTWKQVHIDSKSFHAADGFLLRFSLCFTDERSRFFRSTAFYTAGEKNYIC